MDTPKPGGVRLEKDVILLEQCKVHLEHIAEELERHDRKVDIALEKAMAQASKMCECAQRTEHAIEKLSDVLLIHAKRNGNGNGNGSGAYKMLDLAMKVILTLVGILAMLTLGPASMGKILGQ